MVKQVMYSSTGETLFKGEHIWYNLYRSLRPQISSYVYAFNVPSWRGQEQDLIDDILQETMLRTHKYVQQAEQGEVPPIGSLEAFGHTIARNYCHDLRRRDARLARFPTDNYTFETSAYLADGDESLDEVLDEMMCIAVIKAAACVIARFPEKQRAALLINLAHLVDFDQEPTLLQKALSEVGIHLHEYHRPLPLDPVERGRHNTLVSIAYKRLKHTFNAERNGLVA